MFMAVIAFGLYILFTMDDSQAMSLNSVTKQVNSMSGNNTSGNNMSGNNNNNGSLKGTSTFETGNSPNILFANR